MITLGVFCSQPPVSPGLSQASSNPFGKPTFSGNLQGLKSLGSNDFARSQDFAHPTGKLSC